MIKDKVVISAIKAEMIDLMWPKLQPMVDVAVEYSKGELSTENIKGRLESGDMIALAVTEEGNLIACLTIEKRVFQSGKNILNVTTAGGCDMHLWISDVDEVLDNLAREHGCEDVYIVGRSGWVRTLKDQGYEKTHTVLSRKVRSS